MKILLVAITSLVLMGCAQTTYHPINDAAEKPVFGRQVRFEITDTFYEDLPSCVVVWPYGNAQLEDAAARHLRGKVQRVIGIYERLRLTRIGAYDLANSKDRQAFSITHRCQFGLEFVSANLEPDYLLIWSQKRAALNLVLRRTRDNAVLWRAHHEARRSDGGLALSPLSLIVNAAEAGLHLADKDVIHSVVDDSLRRMFKTLPDMRW